jgi:hypothetical protein
MTQPVVHNDIQWWVPQWPFGIPRGSSSAPHRVPAPCLAIATVGGDKTPTLEAGV